MVRLNEVHDTNAKLVQSQPLVAVFVGATTGIGEYTLRALAAAHGQTGQGLRVYLVGRNEAAAEKIFADCERLAPSATFGFVKCSDVALLKEVDRCCEEVEKRERKAAESGHGSARIDIMVMTQGVLQLGSRQGKQYVMNGSIVCQISTLC